MYIKFKLMDNPPSEETKISETPTIEEKKEEEIKDKIEPTSTEITTSETK